MRQNVLSSMLAAIMILSLVGCATAPKQHVITNSFDYERDFDTVWTAVVEVFAEMNYPIDNMEKDSGLITTDWLSLAGTGNDDYCDCGGLGLTTEDARQGKFNVFVKKGSGGATVRVNCLFRQTRSFGGSSSTVNCVSTGNLEARVNQLISEKCGI